MPRQPERVKIALVAAAERRRALHMQMITGEITPERRRELDAVEARWMDRLLDELHAASSTGPTPSPAATPA